MKFKDVFTPDRIQIESDATDSETVIQELTALIPDADQGEIEELVKQREEQVSTGIGNGIAIPHCRYSGAKKIVGSILKVKQPIDFGAIDGKDVRLFFLLIANPREVKNHIRLLGKISQIAKNSEQLQTLFHENSAEEFMNLLLSYEK